MAEVTHPLALDESLNSTENTPRNIADVLADELVGIKQAINNQSGSGSGHIIQNSSGANMPQENTMQFVDAHLSDDFVGGKTKVENFKAVTQAQYPSQTEDGAYIITDGEGATIEPASDDYVDVTADGVKSYTTLLNELWALIDMSKITHETSLMFYDYQRNTNDYYVITRKRNSNNYLYFICDTEWGSTTTAYIGAMKIASSGSTFMAWEIQSTASSTDISSSVPVSGTKITLYYGNKKATVDLQTTANRCWYDANTNVKQKIDGLKFPRQKNLGTFTTTAQLEAFLSACNVSTGKFDGDIQIGDYVTIAGYKCIIAGFDTEYNKGDTALTTHHITFIGNVGSSKMNTSNTTAGGYEGATTMQTFLSGKETELSAICSTHLLSRSCLTTTNVVDGKSTNWGWNSHKLTLLSETQLYGGVQWGNVFDTGEGCEKLPIFNILSPTQIFGRLYSWLRSVCGSTYFGLLNDSGYPNRDSAANAHDAVVLFCIG